MNRTLKEKKKKKKSELEETDQPTIILWKGRRERKERKKVKEREIRGFFWNTETNIKKNEKGKCAPHRIVMTSTAIQFNCSELQFRKVSKQITSFAMISSSLIIIKNNFNG